MWAATWPPAEFSPRMGRLRSRRGLTQRATRGPSSSMVPASRTSRSLRERTFSSTRRHDAHERWVPPGMFDQPCASWAPVRRSARIRSSKSSSPMTSMLRASVPTRSASFARRFDLSLTAGTELHPSSLAAGTASTSVRPTALTLTGQNSREGAASANDSPAPMLATSRSLPRCTMNARTPPSSTNRCKSTFWPLTRIVSPFSWRAREAPNEASMGRASAGSMPATAPEPARRDASGSAAEPSPFVWSMRALRCPCHVRA